MESMNPQTRTVTLRLHFIRHGETQANLENVVAGHMDSPLTELGIRQAQAAGRYGPLPLTYWRSYASDLGRASMTAHIILDELSQRRRKGTTTTEKKNHPSPHSTTETTPIITTPPLCLDPQLRERAKGVREGRSKDLSFDQAVALYQSETSEQHTNMLPLYETEDDVWKRVQAWLLDIIQDLQREISTMTCMEDTTTTSSGKLSSHTPSSLPTDTAATAASPHTTSIYHVLVVSHSGTLRAVIRTLVGSQLPSEIDLTPAGKDGARPGMLYIPNTSITTIDLEVSVNDNNDNDDDGNVPPHVHRSLQKAKLVELTRADHLDNVL